MCVPVFVCAAHSLISLATTVCLTVPAQKAASLCRCVRSCVRVIALGVMVFRLTFVQTYIVTNTFEDRAIALTLNLDRLSELRFALLVDDAEIVEEGGLRARTHARTHAHKSNNVCGGFDSPCRSAAAFVTVHLPADADQPGARRIA